MKRKTIATLATLGAIALSVATVQSQPGEWGADERGDWGGTGGWEAENRDRPGPGHWGQGRGGRSPEGGMRGMEMAEALGLSEEQLQKIKSIRRTAAKDLAHKQADIRVAQIDMRAMMEDGAEDRKKIHKQIEAIALLHGAVRILQVDQRLDMKAQLTDEQRKIFEKMHRGRGPGRGGPHGMDRGEGKHGRSRRRSMEGDRH